MTDAGRVEINDWLAELLSTPTTEYPQFVAGLSFLASLPPEQAAALLKQRLTQLTLEDAQAGATREILQKHGLPRLLWVEEDCTRPGSGRRDRLRPFARARHRVRKPRRHRVVESRARARLRQGASTLRSGADVLGLHQQLERVVPDIEEDQP